MDSPTTPRGEANTTNTPIRSGLALKDPWKYSMNGDEYDFGTEDPHDVHVTGEELARARPPYASKTVRSTHSSSSSVSSESSDDLGPTPASLHVDQMGAIAVLITLSRSILWLSEPNHALPIIESAMHRADRMDCPPLQELCVRMKGVTERKKRHRRSTSLIAKYERDATLYCERQMQDLDHAERWRSLEPVVEDLKRNVISRLLIDITREEEKGPTTRPIGQQAKTGSISHRRGSSELSVKIPPPPSSKLPGLRRSPTQHSPAATPFTAPISIQSQLSGPHGRTLADELGSPLDGDPSASDSPPSGDSGHSADDRGPRPSLPKGEEPTSPKSPTSPYATRPPGSAHRQYPPGGPPKTREEQVL